LKVYRDYPVTVALIIFGRFKRFSKAWSRVFKKFQIVLKRLNRFVRGLKKIVTKRTEHCIFSVTYNNTHLIGMAIKLFFRSAMMSQEF
jgi:hypothetical protein